MDIPVVSREAICPKTVEDWDAQRNTIHKLYILENKRLHDVISTMEEYGIKITLVATQCVHEVGNG
jgi:hypothetical protein